MALSDPDVGVWLAVSVRFPRAQLAAVVAALEKGPGGGGVGAGS